VPSRSIIIAALLGCCAARSIAAGPQSVDDFPDIGLTLFLRTVVSDRQTVYRATFVDLNADGTKEAVVYLTGGTWCGDDGCGLLVLTRDRRTFHEVLRATSVGLPIRALGSRTNGWRDLAVTVKRGRTSYSVVLPFEGVKYAQSATAPPAHRLAPGTPIEVVISDEQHAHPVFGR